ncbi:hypothetical protein B7494_g7041 [Chlorociboria aeruginascens]|nr:hypothetical protein B7494_g7041 [Chlorociboria aeruginascens]
MAPIRKPPSSAARTSPYPPYPQPAKKIDFRGLKQIFTGKVMSLCGEWKGRKHEQIKKWIELHGGRVEKEVTEMTTHLICSIENFKKKDRQVMKAFKVPTCFIVVIDWLEDCLVPTNAKKRCRAERGYTLDRTIRRIKAGKNAQKTYREKFQVGIDESKELVPMRLNHIYYDSDAFEYRVILTRINGVNTKGNIVVEKYTLYLFESIAKPPTFMFGAKLSSKGKPTAYHRTECRPKLFSAAFKDFRDFFKGRTGIDWDQRLDGLKEKENGFKYTPPGRGRPVGSLPLGWTPPGQSNIETEEDKASVDSDSSAGEGDGVETRVSTPVSTRVERLDGVEIIDITQDTDSEDDHDDDENESAVAESEVVMISATGQQSWCYIMPMKHRITRMTHSRGNDSQGPGWLVATAGSGTRTGSHTPPTGRRVLALRWCRARHLCTSVTPRRALGQWAAPGARGGSIVVVQFGSNGTKQGATLVPPLPDDPTTIVTPVTLHRTRSRTGS